MTRPAKRRFQPRQPGARDDSTARAARAAAKARRLPANPACALCGYTLPVGLRAVPAHLFELHHAAVRAHDGQLVVVVCVRCHMELTGAQQDGNVPMMAQRTALERISAACEALANFLMLLAQALVRWARSLQTTVSGLDTQYSDWRVAPWAA